MTGRETLRDGADRLYNENVTPRNSPAFNWIAPIGLKILEKILGRIGAFIDNHTGFLAPYINTGKEEQAGCKTGYQKAPAVAPAIASGYRMALTREAVLISIYRSQGINPGYRTMRCAA